MAAEEIGGLRHLLGCFNKLSVISSLTMNRRLLNDESRLTVSWEKLQRDGANASIASTGDTVKRYFFCSSNLTLGSFSHLEAS